MKRMGLAAFALSFALTAPASAETRLVFAYWGDPGELPPFRQIVDAYKARAPDVTIEVQHAPWSGYFARLDAQLAAGAGPDVFFLTNVPAYAARGVLEPLDERIRTSGFPISDYDPNALTSHRLDGALYSIPRDTDTQVLYYSKDAFDEAGIAYPDSGWNWQKLREAAMALTRQDSGRVARYGLVLEPDSWPTFVHQNGGKVFDDPFAPTAFLLDEPEAVEAIRFIGDLINKDRAVPNFQEMGQIGNSTQLFASGQAAMVMTNAARLPSFAAAPFKWGAAALPAGPTGIRSNSSGGAGFAINAKTRNKEAAWNFLAFVAGPEGQDVFARSGTAVPAMTGNAEVRAAFAVPYADIFLSEGKNGTPDPQFAKYPEITNLYIQPALDLVWTGESTAEDALADIGDAVNDALRNP